METPPTCWKCEYDLTGLPNDTCCPECGTSIAECKEWKDEAMGLAVGSLVLGLAGFALAPCVPAITLLFWPMGMASGIAAHAAVRRQRASRLSAGLGSAGRIVSGVGVAILLFVFIVAPLMHDP